MGHFSKSLPLKSNVWAFSVIVSIECFFFLYMDQSFLYFHIPYNFATVKTRHLKWHNATTLEISFLPPPQDIVAAAEKYSEHDTGLGSNSLQAWSSSLGKWTVTVGFFACGHGAHFRKINMDWTPLVHSDHDASLRFSQPSDAAAGIFPLHSSVFGLSPQNHLSVLNLQMLHSVVLIQPGPHNPSQAWMTSPGCLAGYVKNKFLVSSSKKVILGKIRVMSKPVTSWNDQCPDVTWANN